MKRLIVNADDFGLTAGVNRAIVECHQRGIVTSTTLMANSAAFDEAVRLARENPRLSIGCHVTLMDGGALSAASDVASLLRDGREFYRTISDFAPRAMMGVFRADDIEREATAQFRRIQQAGITISHLDAHKHAHMFPSVAEPLLRAARACGITRVRNPFEPAQSAPLRLALRRGMFVRWAEVRVLRMFERSFSKLVARYGMKTTAGSLGVMATGTLDGDLLRATIAPFAASTADFTGELVCHPGYNDRDLGGVRTKLLHSRDVERDLLSSPETRDFVERNGFQLISYSEL